ncbi:MAG: 1-deoxy-D-xylulose 5-phosphate reductoisomerase [Rhodocyclales bacterium]|nr:1-deoxy-D-xylulose 5-phosphate reductoisomerase [Rhodocyclales bacterium]
MVLLGATGSVGESTLRVIAAHPDKLQLVGIAARANHARLAQIARDFSVPQVAIFDDAAFAEARKSGGFPAGTKLHGGLDGLVALARLPEADLVLVAVVGTTGLAPALAALAAGKDLALASKEILVLAGKFVIEAAHAHGAKLLPVDSEHNAVFQCLQGHPHSTVRRVTLTASGGAFRDWPVERLALMFMTSHRLPVSLYAAYIKPIPRRAPEAPAHLTGALPIAPPAVRCCDGPLRWIK